MPAAAVSSFDLIQFHRSLSRRVANNCSVNKGRSGEAFEGRGEKKIYYPETPTHLSAAKKKKTAGKLERNSEISFKVLMKSLD